ncbi:unnamed protein product, partial [Hapterophycus canaliculatus]
TTAGASRPASASAAATPSASPASARRLWPYTADLVDGILAGNRTSLSRAITLVESHRLDHRRQAELLLDRVLSVRQEATLAPVPPPRSSPPEGNVVGSSNGGGSGNSSDGPRASIPPENWEVAAATTGAAAEDRASWGRSASSRRRGGSAGAVLGDPLRLGMRLGIAGPPGAGKSSFIEVLGKSLTTAGNRVAVISIDPSSIRTGGSILGDKTRMHELSRDPRRVGGAFVRGCPARGVLGGISRYTHDVVLLCQVAGYDPVIVETVGLGQNEVPIFVCVDIRVQSL